MLGRRADSQNLSFVIVPALRLVELELIRLPYTTIFYYFLIRLRLATISLELIRLPYIN